MKAAYLDTAAQPSCHIHYVASFYVQSEGLKDAPKSYSTTRCALSYWRTITIGQTLRCNCQQALSRLVLLVGVQY